MTLFVEILNFQTKGCVRRAAGSEKREWQKVRGGKGHQTTTQFTLQRCAANTDTNTGIDTDTNTCTNSDTI